MSSSWVKAVIHGIIRIFPELNLFVAINRRARDYIGKVFKLGSLYVTEVRAEDIPALVDGEAFKETVAVNSSEGVISFEVDKFPKEIGITTTEYVADYQLKTPQNVLETREVPWADKRCVYGQPVMCLLAKPGYLARPYSWPKPYVTVAVNRDTEALSAKLAIDYLAQQGEDKRNVRIKTYGGQLEKLVQANYVDACVDVVATGKTSRKKGLKIMAPLFPINLAVVVNKNYLSQLQGR